MSLTTSASNKILAALAGITDLEGPVLPLTLRLLVSPGSAGSEGVEQEEDSGAGTGDGYEAGGQAIEFEAPSGRQSVGSNDIVWENMPATVLVGAEVWDSDSPPQRWHFTVFEEAKVLSDGSDFKLPASQQLLGLD